MTREDDVPPDEDLHFQPPTQEVFVPGLAATTVKVQSLLNSLPSWTLRAGGALRSFAFHAQCSQALDFSAYVDSRCCLADANPLPRGFCLRLW